MKANVAVQIRVTLQEAWLLKRSAKERGQKLAVYVRQAALQQAATDEAHALASQAAAKARMPA